MKSLPFYTLDVFTSTPFTGNPLAVFPNAEGLTDQQMQQIAAELNLSETLFITGAKTEQGWPVRIFMPTAELPFAGHPTVGTAVLLALLEDMNWQNGKAALVLHEQVGPVPVQLEKRADGAVWAQFTTAVPATLLEGALASAFAAQLLGCSENTLARAPMLASCGVPYHLIELSSYQALERTALDIAQLKTCALVDGRIPGICVYVCDRTEKRIQMRMFAPLDGIPEDPATGSAVAALVGALALTEPDTVAYQWRIAQGVEMGRPSEIEAHIQPGPLGEALVAVAGSAVLMSEGKFFLNS